MTRDNDVVVEPMGQAFVLWRCLHSGPLAVDTVDRPPDNTNVPWPELHKRNVPLLTKLAQTYGAYAIVARAANQVVGQLRFYPKAICSLAQSGQLCMQQAYPAGPSSELAAAHFPTLDEITDRTLVVHCMMTGSPSQASNPYQRQSIGTRMARELLRWGKAQGWTAVEAPAYEDLPVLYAMSGAAGRRFWEKIGFHLERTDVEPAFEEYAGLVDAMRADAVTQGIDPASIRNRYTMRIELI